MLSAVEAARNAMVVIISWMKNWKRETEKFDGRHARCGIEMRFRETPKIKGTSSCGYFDSMTYTFQVAGFESNVEDDDDGGHYVRHKENAVNV